MAIDGGTGLDQMTTRVPVNITIADVNNKIPKIAKLEAVEVLEDAPIGTTITTVEATDLDHGSVLRFRLDYAASEALTEDGSQVAEDAWRSLLSLGAVTGDLTTTARLDREVVQQLRLALQVEDIAAGPTRQIAYSRYVHPVVALLSSKHFQPVSYHWRRQ